MNKTRFQPRVGAVVAALGVAGLLAGCGTPKVLGEADKVRDRVVGQASVPVSDLAAQAGQAPRGSGAHADKLAAEQRSAPTLRRANRPFIGATMVPVTDEDKLPAIFHVNYEMDFAPTVRGQQVTLHQVAARLTKLTGVPVRVHQDVMSGLPSAPAPTMPPPMSSAMPSPMLPTPGSPLVDASAAEPAPVRNQDAVATATSMGVEGIQMKWSGTIAGFLNHLVDRLGLSWEYRENTVVIMRYVTEFHEIAALPGAVQYSMSTGGSSSGQSGSNNAGSNATAGLDVNEKGGIDPLTTIEKAVTQMVAAVPGSSVTRSEGSGRLVVKTSREMQAQVRDFIRTENAAMLRQAQIQFEIFSVTTDSNDERGIDWNLALSRLDGVATFGLRAPATLAGTSAGGLSAAILPDVAGSTTSARWGGSEAFLQALSQLGYSAQHRPVSLLTLNRSWARKSRLTSEGYLAETVPGVATSTGAGTPGLKTDTFTVGDQYVALPQILDDNSVLLKFGISLSDLLGLFDVSVGQGETLQKVQTPRITSVNDQYTVALKPGEVLILTGLSREVATNDRRTLAEGMSVGFGGSRKVGVKREHFIVFVRPVIL